MSVRARWRHQGGGHAELGMAKNVYNIYARFAADVNNGTHAAPDFSDALVLQRLIGAIEDSAAAGAVR